MNESVLLLESNLKALRLPTFLANWQKLAQEAGEANEGFERYLLALTEIEVRQREENRRIRRIKAARFPVQKELAEFDFSAIASLNKQRVLHLSLGGYIESIEPILMVGNPGLGKTHVATALGLVACRAGHRVRFYNAAALVTELMKAQDEGRLDRLINRALKHQLIILDELGFIPFTPRGAQLLFQFCSMLYERVALIVTTNLRFADWTQVFGEERLTAALLDRLTHRAHILEFIGESYRFRQRLDRGSKAEMPVDSMDNADAPS